MSRVTVASAPRAPRVTAAPIAIAVAFAHGLNDAYASFLAPLLPRIMDKLGLSIALAATLMVTFNVASSVLQPVLGWAADHFGRRVFVALGPLLSGVFLSLIGAAPGFTSLVTLLVLGGLGSAAFHPPGASYAARVGEGGSGLRLSIFSFGGALGFALGPLLVVGLVARTGLEGMWVAMIPALVAAPLLFAVLPHEGPASITPHGVPGAAELASLLRGPLTLVFGISAVAAFGQRVFVTMTPIAAAQAGRSEAAGALALSVYLGAQAFGTLAGGWLTDRVDRTRLLLALTTLGLPAHVAAVWFTPGDATALVSAALAGFLGMALLPPIVVLAQELVPRRAAASSGVVMGLAWAAGSLGVLVTGTLGDVLGARLAAVVTMPALVVAVLLAARLTRSAERLGVG